MINQEQQELINNMNKALVYRENMINKYDINQDLIESKNEIIWINHLRTKLKNNWIPDYGDVSLEVEKTIKLGLFLRKMKLVKTHDSVISIELVNDNQVIYVDFQRGINRCT